MAPPSPAAHRLPFARRLSAAALALAMAASLASGCATARGATGKEDPATAKPEEARRVFPGSSSLTKDFRLIESGRPGPLLALVGGIHGDESSGPAALRALEFRFGKAGASHSEFSGRLLLIEVANPLARDEVSRTGPSGIDMNRVFPGDPTPEGRRAAAIFAAVRKADLVLDFHEEGLAWPEIDMPTLVTNDAAVPILLDLIDELGRGFVYTGGSPKGSLNAALEAVGVAELTVEMPVRLPEASRVALLELVVEKAMFRLGMIP